MNRIRIAVFALLVASGIALMVLIFIFQVRTPYESTLSPAFSVLGLATKSFNRVLTRVLPVDEIDEKDFGDAIAARYDETADKSDPDHVYLNRLIRELERGKIKPFRYRVYVVKYGMPNAFALPGGVILVTKELMDILGSESELVSILLHEMGHVELSHVFDKVRFEMLAKKAGSETLGWMADFAIGLLLNSSFDKTLEQEADDYGYGRLADTRYEPGSFSDALMRLLDYTVKKGVKENDSRADVFRDYFSSHPPLKIRIEKYSEEADLWWRTHSSVKRYLGKGNLKERIAFNDKDFGPSEWVSTRPINP